MYSKCAKQRDRQQECSGERSEECSVAAMISSVQLSLFLLVGHDALEQSIVLSAAERRGRRPLERARIRQRMPLARAGVECQGQHLQQAHTEAHTFRTPPPCHVSRVLRARS